VVRVTFDPDVLSFRDRIPAFHTISKDQRSITSDDRWRTYFFFGMGYKAEKNCARCPETTRMLEEIPGMRTAFFSILEPGKHIPARNSAVNVPLMPRLRAWPALWPVLWALGPKRKRRAR
jgi:hypothetical protein